MPVSNRRACDRCHAQKLRCPRSGWDNEDSCSRCLHAGAHCVYSAPLPTGRPSNAYNARKKAEARAAQAKSTHSASTSTGSETFVDSVAWSSPNIESLLHSALNMDSNAPWNPYPSDLSSTFSAGSFDEAPQRGILGEKNITLSPTSAADAPKIGTSESWDDLPYIMWPDQTSMDATETCIRQLSDLNVRLYPVYKASCQFAGGQKTNSRTQAGAKLSSSAFDTAALFLQGDGLFEATQGQGRSTLSEIFQAPGTLIDILHRFSTAFPSKSRSSSDSSPSTAMDTGSDEDLGLMTPPSPQSSGDDVFSFEPCPADKSPATEPKLQDAFSYSGETSPDSATHHLVLACYIRLLRIYHTLIIAFQGDASDIKNAQPGSPPLNAELRLVVLVQLVTHLLERLRKSVAGYFDLLPDKTDTGALAAQLASMDALEMPEVDLSRVSGLETGVHDELKRLRNMLQT